MKMPVPMFGMWLEITELPDVLVLAMAEMTLKGELDVTRETREGLLKQLWERMLRESVTAD